MLEYLIIPYNSAENPEASDLVRRFLALTPNLAIEVYFGHVGKHAARLAGSEVRTAHLHDLAIIGGLAVCVAVMVHLSSLRIPPCFNLK